MILLSNNNLEEKAGNKTWRKRDFLEVIYL